MKRLVGLLLFLVFVEDSACAYAVPSRLGAPMGWVFDLLLKPTPLKLRPFDLIFLVILMVGSSKGDKSSVMVAPMRNAVFVVVATTAAWFSYGVLRGGEVRFASWQVYLILSTVLVAFAIASVYRTVEDFTCLGRWLMGAAIYRALMCWISYFTWARHLVGASGAFLTSHDDTISWVVAILILIVNTIDRRQMRVTLRNLALMAFFAGAIQFNSRRLAWVSLGMGLIVTYTLFPSGGATKRRVNRVARWAIPILALYAVVGWGRQNPIFLPLRSLSSVSTKEDASTLARNAENLGLIMTANTSSSALGTGWGQPYIFLTMKYDISGSFELWRYMPHNSILGLLAFTGAIGFAGFWIPIPTAVFFNARVARMSADSKARNLAIIGAAQMVVCANQLYGDMGIFDLKPMYVFAVSYAMAMRIPPLAGVWNARTAKIPSPRRAA